MRWLPSPIGPTAALTFVILGAGCSAPAKLRSVRSDIDSVRETLAAVPTDSDLVPLRCAFHVHSKYSHDSRGRIEAIVRAARKNGIAAVFLTDHTNPRIFTDCPEGWVDGVFLVRGEEITIHGSLLALGTHQSIDRKHKTAQQILDEIIAQGGVCCVSHIETTDPFSIRGYDAIGIHNLHADANQISLWHYPWILLDALLYRDQFARELVFRHIVSVPSKQLRTWDELLQTRRVTAISEADAHNSIRLLGVQLDPYELILGIEHTYLLVPPTWDRGILLDALRAGRSYVGLTMIADPRGFSFALEQGGRGVATIGDEVRWEGGLSFRVRSPGIGKVVLLRDGKPLAWAHGREVDAPCPGPGVYRAEVWVKIGGRRLPWILASPIYVLGNGSEVEAGPAGENVALGVDAQR